MNDRVIAAVLILISTVCSTALAADEGEPAPPLAIKRWVLGEPVRVVGQASDNIYVIAFWATWAKPSTESLLTLAGIQRKFKESNVQVIAISDEPVGYRPSTFGQRRAMSTSTWERTSWRAITRL